MADEPQLSRGDQGEWVTYLQQLLEQAGHSPGAIDGDFGPRTEAAVRACQEAFSLTADGRVGAQTWAVLTGEAAPGTNSGGAGDVPPEFVEAGAPANLSEWTDEQKQAYFQGQSGEDVGGESPEELQVAMIENDGEGSLA